MLWAAATSGRDCRGNAPLCSGCSQARAHPRLRRADAKGAGVVPKRQRAPFWSGSMSAPMRLLPRSLPSDAPAPRGTPAEIQLRTRASGRDFGLRTRLNLSSPALPKDYGNVTGSAVRSVPHDVLQPRLGVCILIVHGRRPPRGPAGTRIRSQIRHEHTA